LAIPIPIRSSGQAVENADTNVSYEVTTTSTALPPMAPMPNHSDNSNLSAIRHPSLISFASDTSASTAIPTPTITSRSTIPGIGSLTGKAIVALGEATLRGVESFAIQVKLKKLKDSFPRKDDDDTQALDSAEMYRDLIELTRYEFFTPTPLPMKI